MFCKGIADAGRAAASQLYWLPGIARDGANDIVADASKRRGRNAAANCIDAAHILCELAYDCGRQDRKTRNAGEDEHAFRARLPIERGDARDKVRTIRQIEIADALFDTRFDDAIAMLAIGLKRAAGVDHDVGAKRGYARAHVAVPIETRALERRANRSTRLYERPGLFDIAAGHDQRQARIVFKQRHKRPPNTP